MILLTYLIQLASLINLASLLRAEDVAPTLPPIWPAIQADKSYRIMFQVQIYGNAERFVVEEWASFEKHLFRLDLIAGGLRTTYLTNGVTGEIFRYKPFVCDQLSADSKELGIIGTLFKGYSLGNDSSKILAYGLGPLWLYSQDATKVTQMLDDSAEFRRHKFLGRYNGYQLSFADPSCPYDLRMYFPKEKDRFVDAIEWVHTSKGNNNAQRPKPDAVEARAKLIYLDESPIDDSTFELPLGYGCQRQAQYEHPFNLDIGMGLLHDGNPNQATLEVTTSRPRDELLNSWVSQKFTIYLMRSALLLGNQAHSYFVTLTQGLDPQTSRLKRLKRVWAAPNMTASEALVYNIDDTSGECQATRMSFKDLVKLPFPSSKESFAQITPVPLGVDLISSLFNDNTGFHMIREKVSFDGVSTFHEVFYEKRLDQFDLKNSEGQIIWTGHVSIVKRIKSMALFSDIPQLVSQYHTTVTLFFYSMDLTQILFKAVIDLMGQEELDLNLMQKEIDIGSCFREDLKEEIIIKYPMESQEISRKLSTIEDLVLERFLVNLFGTTSVRPIQLSNVKLSFDNFFMYVKMTLLDLPLTQTFDLKRGFELVKPQNGSVSSSAVLEKISSSVDKCATSCDFYACYRFSYDYSQYKCILELKQNIAGVNLNFYSDLYQSVKLERNSTRPWDKYNEIGGRNYLRPIAILELFQEFLSYVSSGSSNDDDQNSAQPKGSYENVPLRIYIDAELLPSIDPDKGLDYIELMPVSVHSDIDSMNEFSREELSNHTSSQIGNGSIVTIHEASNLRLQYNILFEGRQFDKDKVEVQKFDYTSFDECSEMCESNDCRSFSYCETKQLCLITNLHKTGEIKKAIYSEPLCSVHILDYLSKFEDFGSTQKPTVIKLRVGGNSEEDCAIACMEEQSLNCQGFYHCMVPGLSINGESASCFLEDRHIEEDRSEDDKHSLVPLGLGMSFDQWSNACRYFSRSYLAQFDSYLGKALKYEMDTTTPSTEIVVGLGAESCGQKCIQESCLAFHVCLDPIDHSHVCELAKRQVLKSNLVSRKRCTTFVLSDKSQFNLNKTKLIYDNPNKMALDKNNKVPDVVIDAKQDEATKKDIYANLFDWFWSLEQIQQIKEGSVIKSKLISLLVGAVIGIICTVIWIQKDTIHNMITKLRSQY